MNHLDWPEGFHTASKTSFLDVQKKGVFAFFFLLLIGAEQLSFCLQTWVLLVPGPFDSDWDFHCGLQ